MRVFVILVVAAISLAGCADDPAVPGGEEGPGEAMHMMHGLTFGGDPVDVEPRTITGHFSWEQNGDVRDITEEVGVELGGVHSHDIADMIPAGFPVIVRVTADAPLGEGDIDVWLDGDGGTEFYFYRCDCQYGGHNEIESSLMSNGGGLEIWIQYDEFDDGTEFDYTLTVSVEGAPDLIPEGVPFEVTLPQEGAHVFVGNTSGPVMVWDPRDEYMGAFDDGGGFLLEVDANMTAGGYAFVARPASAVGQLGFVSLSQNVIDGVVPGPPRILDFDFTFEQFAVASDTTSSTTLTLATQGVEAFGCAFSDSPIQIDMSFGIDGPQGELGRYDHVTLPGDPTSILGIGICVGTGFADGAAVAGDYTATVSGTAGGGIEYFLYVASIVR